MDKLIIAEVHPLLNGEYELAVESFSNWELHVIKRSTGLTAGDMQAAYERLDNDIIVSLALVVLMREGKTSSRTPWTSDELDALWKAPVGAIYIEQEEADASPPEIPASEPVSKPDEPEKNGSSGGSSRVLSGLSANDPSSTGDLT